jgi:hypothetical protein
MQPPAELLLADSERLRIRMGLRLVPQRGAEADQRLQGGFARLP